MIVTIMGTASSAQQVQFNGADVLANNMLKNPFSKTLGGKQFWTDVDFCGGWRIQQNAATEHYRLIDSNKYRHASGTLEDCLKVKQEKLANGQIQPESGRVVIVLHGLIRTSSSMQKMADYLQSSGSFTAINFGYATTRKPIAYHAAALEQLVDSLDEKVTEINFVAHSMGNIVTRHYLANIQKQGKSKPFGRMVMIGPPNQGSKMARLLRYSLMFNVVAGGAGQQLGAAWQKLEPNLAIPDFEFGIIAGGQADGQPVSNFLLPGKDDFTVAVEEAKLEGAADMLVKPLLHGTMMKQSVTLQATLNFLEHGYFVSAEQKQPIRAEPEK